MFCIDGEIKDSLIISRDSEICGSVSGDVTVKPNVHLKVHGTVRGNLRMESASEVAIYGIVSGNVINRGGKLVVFGKVSGEVTSFAPPLCLHSAYFRS